MKRKDLMLLAGILAAALLIWAASFLFRQEKTGEMVEIQQGNEITERLSLREDCRKVIKGAEGENVLVIENGTARIEEADCPDGLCVRQGSISRPGESIICLPHRLAVRVAEGDGT